MRTSISTRSGLVGLVVWGAVLTLAVGCADDDGGGGGAYSDATLSGPWIGDPDDPSAYAAYFIFDGAGGVTEVGTLDEGTPPGTYQVEGDGSFTLSINHMGSTQVFDGTLSSDTQGTWTITGGPGAGLTGAMLKVTDTGLLAGDWTGTVNGTSVTFTVDASGVVTALTGFTGLVRGKMYAVGANFCGQWQTSEAAPDDEMFFEGTWSGDSASGVLLDSDMTEHTCSFTRTGG